MENDTSLSEQVLGCAHNISRELGVGFLEAVYENALALELEEQSILFRRQQKLEVKYKNTVVGQYIADFVINNKLILELKALSSINGNHEAQLMNYLCASGLTVGLILNFGTQRLGIRRIVWNYDETNKI